MNAHGITISRIIPLEIESMEQAVSQPDEVDAELLPFFEEEASAELQEIEKLLHAWDDESSYDFLKDVRRHFHTLKGTANSIGLVRLGALAGGMEDLFAQLTPTGATEMRSHIIKTSVTVIEAIRALIREAHQPKFSPIRKEEIIAAVALVMDLKQKDIDWKGGA